MIDEFNRLAFAPYEFSFFRTKNGSPVIDNYYLKFGKKFINKLNTILISNYHVDISYSNNFSLNAFVDILKENNSSKDIIDINYGVLIKSYKTMYDLVARYNVLNQHSIEFKTNELIGIKYSYKFDDYQMYETILTLPKHSDMLLADFMAMISIKFIFLHEIGHLFNGHVSLYKASSSDYSKKLFMTLLNFDTNLTALDFRTMEMDADAFAITNLIDDIIELWKNDDRLKAFCSNLQDLFYLIAFTLNILLLMVQDENTKDISTTNTNQLDFLNRIIFSVGSFKTNVLYKFKEKIDINNFDNVMNAALKKSTIYYNTIYRKEQSWFDDNSSNISKNHTEISSNWKSLRKRLLPLSRLPLAP